MDLPIYSDSMLRTSLQFADLGRMNVADAEHHVLPRRREVRAFPTDHCARAQLRHRSFFGFSTGWRRGGGCRKRRFGILRRSQR